MDWKVCNRSRIQTKILYEFLDYFLENSLIVLRTWDDLKPQVHEHLIGFQVVRRLPLKISYQLSKKSKEPFINYIIQ